MTDTKTEDIQDAEIIVDNTEIFKKATERSTIALELVKSMLAGGQYMAKNEDTAKTLVSRAFGITDELYKQTDALYQADLLNASLGLEKQ